MSVEEVAVRPTLGDLLRYWRSVRGKSQLDVSSEAGTTPRYVSFVETGRAQPTRQMVVRLARALEVPLRERNDLLLAAGFAPLYSVEPLGSPALDQVDRALTALFDRHEPFPAVALDRGWQLQRANEGARSLFGRLLAPEPLPTEVNVLRLVIEPGPLRDRLTNWEQVVPALLERTRREAIGSVLDHTASALVAELSRRPDVEAALAAADSERPTAPVIDLRFVLDGVELAFFSVVSTIGSPVDVTAQELRIESFFPADDDTSKRWLDMYLR
jgi:transcriptional regulator with XRE-family HTH domain